MATPDVARGARISSHTVGAFQENCYVLVDDASMRAVVVDPGAEGDRLVRAIRATGASLDGIWLTHAHIDHIGAIAELRRQWDAPIWMHPADQRLYERGAYQAAHYGLPFEVPPAVDHPLADGDELQVGDLTFTVLHTPGHAPGHCAFLGGGALLAGDLLFAGSIGRTDLPFADPRQMTQSLARISELPANVVVHPGHGPRTTVGRELETNPFLNGVGRVVGG